MKNRKIMSRTLRKHVDERECREALELVNIGEEVATFLGPRICAAECGKTNRRYQEPAEERRTVLSDPPFGQVHQEHLTFVHDFADVEIAFGRCHDAVEQGIG